MKEGIHINSKVGFSYLKVTFSLLFDSDLCMLQLINTTTANQVWRTIIVSCLFIIQNKMFYSRALVSLLLCMGLHLCFTYNNFSLHQSWETGIIMKIYIKSVVTVWGNWSPERSLKHLTRDSRGLGSSPLFQVIISSILLHLVPRAEFLTG